MELLNPDVNCIEADKLTEVSQLVQLLGPSTLSAFPSDETPIPEGCDGWHFVIKGLVHSTPDIKVYMNQIINTRLIHGDIPVHPKCTIEVI